MSEIALDAVGLVGVKYVYGGTIKRLELADGSIIRLKQHPWNLKEDALNEISTKLDRSVTKLEDAFIALHDAFEEAPAAKRAGVVTQDIKETLSWEDVIKTDAKGNTNGLNAEAIAILLAPGHARIGDTVFKVENNIGEMLSEEMLKIDIISGLKTVGAADQYAMNTYKLVRDQMLPLVPESRLGDTEGYLPVKNGVLDIVKGEIVPVDGIYLKTLEVAYDPDAKDCSRIMKMINNMFEPQQKELVLSVLGAAISGAPAPFILALSGSGRNGKSQLRKFLEGLMQELITTEKLENLNKEFVNSVFLGKRISWQTEVNSSRQFLEQIKDITGSTTLQIRRKFINGELQYNLQMVCILDTNNPMHLDESKAIKDRLRFINMPKQFVYELTGADNEVLIDPTLLNGWKDELPAFLNVLLPYAKYFLENGRLMHDIAGTHKDLKDRSNLLSIFITEFCDAEDEYASVSMTTFYNHFAKYADKMNVAIPEIDQVRYKLRKDEGFKVAGNKISGLTLLKQKKLAQE